MCKVPSVDHRVRVHMYCIPSDVRVASRIFGQREIGNMKYLGGGFRLVSATFRYIVSAWSPLHGLLKESSNH